MNKNYQYVENTVAADQDVIMGRMVKNMAPSWVQDLELRDFISSIDSRTIESNLAGAGRFISHATEGEPFFQSARAQIRQFPSMDLETLLDAAADVHIRIVSFLMDVECTLELEAVEILIPAVMSQINQSPSDITPVAFKSTAGLVLKIKAFAA